MSTRATPEPMLAYVGLSRRGHNYHVDFRTSSTTVFKVVYCGPDLDVFAYVEQMEYLKIPRASSVIFVIPGTDSLAALAVALLLFHHGLQALGSEDGTRQGFQRTWCQNQPLRTGSYTSHAPPRPG